MSERVTKLFMFLSTAPRVCRDASNTKESKYGTKFPLKFKLHRSKCLNKNTKIIFYNFTTEFIGYPPIKGKIATLNCHTKKNYWVTADSKTVRSTRSLPAVIFHFFFLFSCILSLLVNFTHTPRINLLD